MLRDNLQRYPYKLNNIRKRYKLLISTNKCENIGLNVNTSTGAKLISKNHTLGDIGTKQAGLEATF
jgi:hypothetical protein